jgi:hypothetical protein
LINFSKFWFVSWSSLLLSSVPVPAEARSYACSGGAEHTAPGAQPATAGHVAQQQPVLLLCKAALRSGSGQQLRARAGEAMRFRLHAPSCAGWPRSPACMLPPGPPPPALGLDGEGPGRERGDDKGESFWIGLRVIRFFSIALNVSSICFYFFSGHPNNRVKTRSKRWLHFQKIGVKSYS